MKKVLFLLIAIGLMAGGWFVYTHYFKQYPKTADEFELDKKRLTPEQLAFKYDPGRQLFYMSQIKLALEMYYGQKKSYPNDLSELASITSIARDHHDDFFYAYYPESNPQHCHLGIKLSSYMRELDNDDDFNSKEKGYINGFNGADPIYDKVLSIY